MRGAAWSAPRTRLPARATGRGISARERTERFRAQGSRFQPAEIRRGRRSRRAGCKAYCGDRHRIGTHAGPRPLRRLLPRQPGCQTWYAREEAPDRAEPSIARRCRMSFRVTTLPFAAGVRRWPSASRLVRHRLPAPPSRTPATGTYHVSEDFTTWAAAQAWATSLGGYLVTITSGSEDAWLQANLGLGAGYYWIGGRSGRRHVRMGHGRAVRLPELPCPASRTTTPHWVAAATASRSPRWTGSGSTRTAILSASWAARSPRCRPRPTWPSARASTGLRLTAQPSVVTSTTRIAFELGRAASVRCRVFDAGGRCVRVLDARLRRGPA